MTDDEAFLAAIRADATDNTARLAYADWLEDRADSRAEFVRRLAAQASEPGNQKHHTRLRSLRKSMDPLWLAAVGDTARRLRNIARVLDQREEEETFGYLRSLAAHEGVDPELRFPDSCLVVRETGSLLDIEVCAHATDPIWALNLEEDLCASFEGIADVGQFIGSREVAPAVRSLYLWTNVAANGTAEINLDGYAAGGGQFTNLKHFGTNYRNEDGECIIADNSDEDAGPIGKLLAKCPAVEEMRLPSAPDRSFFSVGVRPLKRLSVKAVYPMHGFIQNLSRSTCFPYLEALSYEEGDLGEEATPFDDFVALLRSPVLKPVKTVEIRCSTLQDQELQQLQTMRREGATFRR